MTKNIRNSMLALSKNENFLEIDRILNSKKIFNIFNATGIKTWEIKHTKFLSYLLDPTNLHNLKDDFLLSFLDKLRLPDDVANDILTSNALVKSEKPFDNGQIDLIIQVPSVSSPKHNHVFIIENKIKSLQRDGQLKKYRIWSSDFYGKSAKSIHHYFLTNTQEDPKDDWWINVLYKDTIELAIKDIQLTIKENPYLERILEDYLNIFQDEDKCRELAGHLKTDQILQLKELNNLDEWPEFYVQFRNRYPSAVEFLEKSMADPRSENDLKDFFQKEFNKTSGVNVLYYEDSSDGGQWLRFGFLNNENIEYVKKMSASSRSSGSNIFMVLRVVWPDAGKNIFNCDLCVGLDPFNEECKIYREEIFCCIKNTIQSNNKWNAKHKSTKFPISNYASKDITYNEVENWIRSVLQSISNDPIIDELNKNLRECFEKIMV